MLVVTSKDFVFLESVDLSVCFVCTQLQGSTENQYQYTEWILCLNITVTTEQHLSWPIQKAYAFYQKLISSRHS